MYSPTFTCTVAIRPAASAHFTPLMSSATFATGASPTIGTRRMPCTRPEGLSVIRTVCAPSDVQRSDRRMRWILRTRSETRSTSSLIPHPSSLPPLLLRLKHAEQVHPPLPQHRLPQVAHLAHALDGV